jgi:beta-glucanase (GH16 family)
MLDFYLHTENGTPMSAAIMPTLPGNHLYGKLTLRFRADYLPGFKFASLLWPSNDNWPQDGEIDFPETGLSGLIQGYLHFQNGTGPNDQQGYDTGERPNSWHTASVEWLPGRINFILDGQLIGTDTARVPSTPMDWILQSEACIYGCPAAGTAGNLQIAWLVAYTPV